MADQERTAQDWLAEAERTYDVAASMAASATATAALRALISAGLAQAAATIASAKCTVSGSWVPAIADLPPEPPTVECILCTAQTREPCSRVGRTMCPECASRWDAYEQMTPAEQDAYAVARGAARRAAREGR